MKLEGTKIDFLGDSITEGSGTSGPDCRFSALLQRSCKLAAVNPDFNMIDFRQILHQIFKISAQILRSMCITVAHIQMQNRIFLPVIRFAADGQPLKQLPPALENSFQGGNGQRFSKPARTRKKEHRTVRLNHLPDKFRLIRVQEIPLPQFFERINAGCQFKSHFSPRG